MFKHINTIYNRCFFYIKIYFNFFTGKRKKEQKYFVLVQKFNPRRLTTTDYKGIYLFFLSCLYYEKLYFIKLRDFKIIFYLCIVYIIKNVQTDSFQIQLFSFGTTTLFY